MQAAEGFDEAMTIDVYLSRMRENREAFIRNIEQTTVTDAERAVLGGEPLRILTLHRGLVPGFGAIRADAGEACARGAGH